ncbi:MAG: hypothetical protein ACJ77A_01315 [Actinomycetota bacterium]
MPGPDRINLSQAIQGPWRHAVLMTFGLDLGFFERAVLPQLGQTRGRLVLADHEQLLAHQMAAARGRLVRQLNRSYVVGGVAVSGVAHAKLILLMAESQGRLLVGSGNLRLTGWGAIGELFTRYDLTEDDDSMLGAFLGAKELLDGLLERHLIDDFAGGYLEEIWSRTPWLGRTSAIAPLGPVRHSLATSLLDQFVAAVEKRGVPEDLLLFAPFHDPECAALSSLLERTTPEAATLLVQPKHTSIDPQALARVMSQFPRLTVRPFGPRGDHSRPVHAKFILARFEDGHVCLQGSANVSRAGLMKTIPEGNVEITNLLTGDAESFSSVMDELWLGEPVSDPAELHVDLRPITSVLPATAIRVLEAHWDGNVLTFRLAGSFDKTTDIWVRLGSAFVPANLLNAELDPSRTGQLRLTLRLPDGVEELFSRAVPVAIYLGDGPPPAEVSDEQLTDPIFCVNQPFLIEQLDARSATVRLRDVGLMSLENDRELEELLRALQGTMVYDRRTLIEARPPVAALEPDMDDEQLLIAYADVDYEALRASPRIGQYRHALAAGSKAGSGPLPTDIQLALRSITDAFADIVGRIPERLKQVTFSSDWTAQEDDQTNIDDPALLEGDLETETPGEEDEASVDIEELEDEVERRWSQAARLRVHWRNFMDRYLTGLRSPAWQELVGTAVLSGNYEIFSHVLQRLHRQPWLNFDFTKFLVHAQAETHGFVWGLSGSASAGWLSNLPERDRVLVTSAFIDRHLAVRLLVDLAGCSALTRSDELDPSYDLIQERKGMRDVARAILVHPSWTKLVSSEMNLIRDATAIAGDLAAGEYGYWPVPPTADRLVSELRDLARFTTSAELQQDVAGLLGAKQLNVHVRRILLGPEGRQVVTQDLEVDGLLSIDLETALMVMARFAIVDPGPRYRVHAGRSWLLYDRDSGEIQWLPDLYSDEIRVPKLPTVESPWDVSITSLSNLVPAEASGAVA